MRDRFVELTGQLLAEDPALVVVLADIGVSQFRAAGVLERFPGRIINMGIREQLLVSFAAGLALEGFRPIVHTYAPFLVERPFEQVKLDFGHQAVSGIFVSVGASYDSSISGRTHHAPEDVALMMTLPDWRIHVPGHSGEVERVLRDSLSGDRNTYIRLSDESNKAGQELPASGMGIVRAGSEGSPVVVAIGPKLDPTLRAVEGLDVTVLYASTIQPLDHELLRRFVTRDIVVVEPYLSGTSAPGISAALQDIPHRLLSLGVGRTELRRYGTIDDHNTAHGLDAAALRARITSFLSINGVESRRGGIAVHPQQNAPIE